MAESIRIAALEKIIQCGWNAYEASITQKAEQIISKGPTKALELEKDYVLFAAINRSNDPTAVIANMQRMIGLGKIPLCHYQGIAIPLGYISIREEGIVAHSMMDILIPYSGVKQALDDLVNARNVLN